MDSDKLIYIAIMVSTGIPILILGFLIWKKEMINLIHSYHYSDVPENAKKPYLRSIGILLSIYGLSFICEGIVYASNTPLPPTLLVIVATAIFIALFSVIQYKYNRKIFSFQGKKTSLFHARIEDIQTGRFYMVMTILSIASIFITFAALSALYPSLTDMVPSHYNFSGEPDAYAHKSSVFIFAFISPLMYIFLSLLEKFPNTWNMKEYSSPEKTRKAYAIVKNMIGFIKFELCILFSYISLLPLFSRSPGNLFGPVILISSLLPIIITSVKLSKIGK